MCLSPIYINNNTLCKDTSGVLASRYSSFMVPCGKCDECLKVYQNSWMQRLVSEARHCGTMYFVTLTYREDDVPWTDTGEDEIYMTVDKKHIQNWLKAYREDFMRRHEGVRPKFKYFICSEYGPKHGRPHYHCLFFGLDKEELYKLVYRWRYGYVDVKTVGLAERDCANVARYVAKYCAKGGYENPHVKEGKCSPCFKLVSKHLGEDYIIDNYLTYLPKSTNPFGDKYLGFLATNLKYVIDGFSYTLCRYYKDKLFKKYEDKQNPSRSHPAKPYLRSALADYQRSVFESNYRERVEQYMHDHNTDLATAYRAILAQDDVENFERRVKVRESFLRFYGKSRF